MDEAAASRIQSHADKTGQNQGSKQEHDQLSLKINKNNFLLAKL